MAASGIGGGSLGSSCTHRPLCPPSFSSSSSSYRTLSDHLTHPLRMGLIPFSVRRDCTARGRYWGAYRSARGGAPLTLYLLVSISLYLSLSFSSSLSLSFYLYLLFFASANLPFHRSYVHVPSISPFPIPPILPLHLPRILSFSSPDIHSPWSFLPTTERWEARALWTRVTRETPQRNYRYRIGKRVRIRENALRDLSLRESICLRER